jgi:hypothetical protein
MAGNITVTNSLVSHLTITQKQLTQCLSVFLVFGVVGNTLSLVVFRQRKLRSNAIALLFSAASIFNMLVLIYGIGTSLYAVDHVSPDTYSIVFCKLRLYLRHILLMIVRSYIILACAASFALSSSRAFFRAWCQPRYVNRAIIVVPLVWPVIAFHMPIWSTLRRNQCVNIDPYVLPFAIYFFLIVGVIPVILMCFFILLTINNLHGLHRRAQASVKAPLRWRSRDQQFIRMLCALVIMYATTNLFFPSNSLYLAITTWLAKSPERVAIESLIFNVTSNYILYINNISPFYLFFVSSASFRQSLFRILRACRRNKVQAWVSEAPKLRVLR